jgi:plastocyanin
VRAVRLTMMAAVSGVMLMACVSAPAMADSGRGGGHDDGGGGGGGGGGNVRDVQVRDDCDPATFNAAIGSGACVGNGHTTFAQFQAKLNPTDFGDGHWKFNPDHTDLKRNESLHPFNRGGETHTFTAVAQFGPGCVAALNQPLGLTGPAAVPDCQAALANTALHPGDSRELSNLTPGVHRYMCVIHPWMRTTITVR